MLSKMQYTVSCLEGRSHYFHVEIRIRGVGADPVRLAMPVWTPGAYQVHDFAGRVHDVRCTAEGGKALRWNKVDKSTWRIVPSGGDTIVVSYRVYALEVDVDKSYLDDLRATINGASVYMYAVDRTEEPHEVTFRMPPAWKTINTGLEPVPRQRGTYRAASFDELVDCPVMMGNHRVERFDVRGVPHHVVFVGAGNYELEHLLDDMRKIVEHSINVFDVVPYKHYTFFMELTPDGYGGLEHRNSTHMIFSACGFKPRKDYAIALGLISHEFFHTWNVKRLRPHPLGPFDYSREVYTPLLWFAEGFTSYYDLQILRRAGCIGTREYLDEMGREIRRLTLSPGRLHQSLEESSFDTWIKLYRPTPDSANTTISYYNKGCLFGMALDLEIRHRTKGKRTLDDVMRSLYRRHFEKDDRGITPEDIERACDEVVGSRLKGLFDKLVRSAGDVDWNRYLALAGLEISSKQKPKAPAKLKYGDERTRAYLGLRLKPGGTVVSQVVGGGGAHEAGLATGDELLALDGFRLDESKLDKWLGHLPPGRTVRMTITRSGRLRELNVTLVERPLVDFAIQPRRTAHAGEKEICRGWLCERWKGVDRPDHGFDFRPREKLY